MALIYGQTIKLFDRIQTGTDAFNAPVYEEVSEDVRNILVCPVSTEDVDGNLQLYGRHAVYELLIPKDDTHQWEDREVSFYGHRWRTFGSVQEWPAPLVPGPWNKRVRVEWYG